MKITPPRSWLPGTFHFSWLWRLWFRDDAGRVIQSLMLRDGREIFEVRSCW